MENWKFDQYGILNSSSNAKCNEIFQAFCNELGSYYASNNGKYAKSGPHITFSRDDIKLKLCFWSSRSNTPGEYVNLEIIPSFYSFHVESKAGYFWGYPGIFNKKSIEITKDYNIYGANEELFYKIVGMINEHVLPLFDIFNDTNETDKYLASIDPKYRGFSIFSNQGLEQFLEQKHHTVYEKYFLNNLQSKESS